MTTEEFEKERIRHEKAQKIIAERENLENRHNSLREAKKFILTAKGKWQNSIWYSPYIDSEGYEFPSDFISQEEVVAIIEGVRLKLLEKVSKKLQEIKTQFEAL